MCETVVETVKKSMESTKVVEEVSAIAEQVCDLMPTPYSTLCHTLVKTYVGLIMELLEQGLAALDVCVRIGLCEPAPSAKKAVRMPRKFSEDWACKMCQTVVETVKESMESTQVVEEVTVIVEQLCDLMPAPYSTLCHTLVKTYVGLIIELLDQGLEALDICVRIGLCPGTRRPYPHARMPVVAHQKNGLTCDACKFFIRWAGSQLATVTKAELWRLVSVECPKVEYIKYICSYVTEENIDTFVDLIASHVEPQEACQWVNLC